MRYQPSAGDSPWEVGMYPWSEAFLWIGAVLALLFGLFLLASYLNNRKKPLLLWSISFLGIWRLYSTMIAGETYEVLAGGWGYDMWGIWTALLVMIIPGFFAAGLLHDKDKKFGAIYAWIVVGLSVIWFLLMAEPNGKWFDSVDELGDAVVAANAAGIRYSEIIGDILQLVVTLISSAMVIALPIMKEGRLGPKTMVAIAGIFMFTTSLLWGLLALVVPGFNFVDKVCMLFPFFFIAEVFCLLVGIANNKDWGFSIANIEFEEK